jgi:hypothetical protein
MRMRLWLTGMLTACLGAGLVAAAPAQAADEWSTVANYGGVCDVHHRYVDSSVRGNDAVASFVICWTDDLSDVRVFAEVSDGNGNDGYHAEARIRYQIWTGSGWSGWHYRTPAAAYGPGDGNRSWLYRANQTTRNVQAAACLYNGSTAIDCDDRGWQ